MTDTTDLTLLADDTLDAELADTERELQQASTAYYAAVGRYSTRVQERFRRRLLACYPAACPPLVDTHAANAMGPEPIATLSSG